MNILEVYKDFLPKNGGVEVHISDLCKCMTERGDKPLVLVWGPELSSFKIIDKTPVKHVRIPSFFAINRYLLISYLTLQIILTVKKHKIDVIHAHDYLPSIPSVLAGVFLKKPVVATFHLPVSITTLKPPTYLSVFLPIEKILKRYFAYFVSQIICVCEFTRKDSLSVGFPNSKLRVIYNWPTFNLNPINSNQRGLEKFGLDKRPFILFVGRLYEKQKSLSTAISAVKLLVKKGLKITLVIVGNGSDEEAYKRYCKKLNITGNVVFLSSLLREELAILYKECKLFVLPSKCEGLPLVILEAMNFSKPIVATNVGGVPELVKDGFNGILVDSNSISLSQGLLKVLSNEETLRIFGERSKFIVTTRFSTSNCNETVRLIENASALQIKSV